MLGGSLALSHVHSSSANGRLFDESCHALWHIQIRVFRKSATPVRGDALFNRNGRTQALCENRVTRLSRVVMGTAFATRALHATIN